MVHLPDDRNPEPAPGRPVYTVCGLEVSPIEPDGGPRSDIGTARDPARATCPECRRGPAAHPVHGVSVVPVRSMAAGPPPGSHRTGPVAAAVEPVMAVDGTDAGFLPSLTAWVVRGAGREDHRETLHMATKRR